MQVSTLLHFYISDQLSRMEFLFIGVSTGAINTVVDILKMMQFLPFSTLHTLVWLVFPVTVAHVGQ